MVNVVYQCRLLYLLKWLHVYNMHHTYILMHLCIIFQVHTVRRNYISLCCSPYISYTTSYASICIERKKLTMRPEALRVSFCNGNENRMRDMTHNLFHRTNNEIKFTLPTLLLRMSPEGTLYILTRQRW